MFGVFNEAEISSHTPPQLPNLAAKFGKTPVQGGRTSRGGRAQSQCPAYASCQSVLKVRNSNLLFLSERGNIMSASAFNVKCCVLRFSYGCPAVAKAHWCGPLVQLFYQTLYGGGALWCWCRLVVHMRLGWLGLTMMADDRIWLRATMNSCGTNELKVRN